MKMKAVCEATGLTDRAVRYYIAEALISPAYTENYLGRRAFDFSPSDVKALNDIAVLRKFGFSVGEIKEMLLHPEAIPQAVKNLQLRKQAVLRDEQALLGVLSRLDARHSYTVPELAAFLSAPVEETALPPEDARRRTPKAWMGLLRAVAIGVITWLPIALSALTLIDQLRTFAYPKVEPWWIFWTLVSLLPSFFTLLLPKIKRPFRGRVFARKLLPVLCVLSIPVSFTLTFGIVSCSETTDMHNYRDLDVDCLVGRSSIFQELFPLWPHYFVNERQPDGSIKTIDLDAHYYYRYHGYNWASDIYAQWPLEQDAFYAEIARAEALFAEYALPEDKSGYHYATVQKGSYTCLILYRGAPPFEAAAIDYTCCIFAYDTQTLTVRYIYSDSSEDGAYQPYYLTLEW